MEKGATQKRYIKSISLKIEKLQYIAIYYNGLIFNETDFISKDSNRTFDRCTTTDDKILKFLQSKITGYNSHEKC